MKGVGRGYEQQDYGSKEQKKGFLAELYLSFYTIGLKKFDKIKWKIFYLS